MNLITAIQRGVKARIANMANFVKLIAAFMIMSMATGARAAGFTVDTTDVVAAISGGVTTISAVGVAVLSLVVVIKLFKWVQRVL